MYCSYGKIVLSYFNLRGVVVVDCVGPVPDVVGSGVVAIKENDKFIIEKNLEYKIYFMYIT